MKLNDNTRAPFNPREMNQVVWGTNRSGGINYGSTRWLAWIMSCFSSSHYWIATRSIVVVKFRSIAVSGRALYENTFNFNLLCLSNSSHVSHRQESAFSTIA